jgi:hypothetical protein
MDIRQILMIGGVPVIDPTLSSYSPDEFLAKYGSYMDSICLIAKSESGSTFYPSNTAPKHHIYSEFFSSFAQIAADIGIKVYGLINSNLDYYLSRDPNFQMHHSGGFPVEGFVCPARQTYWFYLAELAAEISRYPIEGLILKETLYPRDTTCFCESCRREFANLVSIDRDFSKDQIKNKAELFKKWQLKRIESLNGMISHVVSRVHSEKKIEILTELLVDQSTDYLKGTSYHFAQDINFLSRTSSHLLIHLNPWTNTFPGSETPEFDKYVQELGPIKDKIGNLRNSLFLWGANEQNLEFADQMRGVLNSQNLFLMLEQPSNLLDRRSLHLGLF